MYDDRSFSVGPYVDAEGVAYEDVSDCSWGGQGIRDVPVFCNAHHRRHWHPTIPVYGIMVVIIDRSAHVCTYIQIECRPDLLMQSWTILLSSVQPRVPDTGGVRGGGI